jgi:hypothetical protein
VYAIALDFPLKFIPLVSIERDILVIPINLQSVENWLLDGNICILNTAIKTIPDGI